MLKLKNNNNTQYVPNTVLFSMCKLMQELVHTLKEVSS